MNFSLNGHFLNIWQHFSLGELVIQPTQNVAPDSLDRH